MKTAIGTILNLLVCAGLTISYSHAEQVNATDQVVATMLSGTIEDVDPIQRIVTINSEEVKGEVRLLAFTQAKTVKGLTKGDRVVIELDEHGVAQKIVKTAPSLDLAPDSEGN